ncbi:DNA polymerase III subunit alpha [Paenarthrobacter sp. YJN-5]|uniref:DNA polymerase III subunit alpha n=1 Tax=Paenarthrobacter sp. YJN-5 TaxID=2735316 RepID=UPI0018780418|nr:DNA polymerase III subunit alpha [Paenarthrobacter sp. YJN-5]QOT19238.1 DNA polymerase III subunit alpha [Paenarthrobacter sp. YJN-5]
MAFVHLHNHTEHSGLDGLSRIKSVPKRAAALGQNAMAETEHGSLAGAWRFTKACQAAGIKPIIGIEIYMSIGDRFERNSEIVDRNDDTTADADDGKGDTKEKRYEHLTLLARNETGWKNLLALHNKAEESYWYKPRIDYALLKEHGEGLIVLSGCLAGPVAGPLSRAAGEAAKAAELEAREPADEAEASKLAAEAKANLAKSAEFAAEARKNLDTLIDCVGKENVYLEIMYHGIDAEQSVLKPIGQLSREYEIPMVVTNDCHYEKDEDADAHEGFLAVGSKKGLDDPARFKFNGSGYYVKSEQEMLDIMPGSKSWADACAMTQVIADRCDDQVIPTPHQRLPHYPLPEGFDDSNVYLKKLVQQGAIDRYGYDVETKERIPLSQEVKDRLRAELDIIAEMGFPDYFLIMWDVINWCRSDAPIEFDNPDAPRKKPILVGPGRGSAAGSAVSYCLGIVGLDPLYNNLLFERFLEPGRAGMPDIDVDFEKGRRDEVFAYLGYRWGKGNVARIGTFGVALSKAAIKDAARILKPSGPSEEIKAQAKELFAVGERGKGAALLRDAEKAASERASQILRLGNKMSDLVPTSGEKAYDFAHLADTKDQAGQAFRDLVEEAGQDAQDILEMARAFEGVIKNESIHACGFVVSPEPLDELVPLRWASHAADADPAAPRVICWDGPEVEDYGFLKMDILGLMNLDIVSTALENIEMSTGEKLTMDDIPHPDTKGNPKVDAAFALIAAGNTGGVFQMESAGMVKIAQDVVPESLTDISAIVALFRPGPLAAKVPDRYAARKNGLEEVDYNQFTSDPVEQEWIASVLGETYGVFCVAEGERVYSATRGLMVPIEDLKVGEMVQGVDANGVHRLAPVTAHALTGHRQVFRLTLADGKSVRLTDDHPVLTHRGWVKVAELRPNDTIATPWELLKDANCSEELPVDEGRLLGYLLGDGSLATGTRSSFTNKDDVLHAEFARCVSSVFPGYAAKRLPGTIHSVIAGNERQGGLGGSVAGKHLEWLRGLGLKQASSGCHSRDKFIPAAWLSQLGDPAWSLVGALWDCDGTIGLKVAAYKTISKQLCEDLSYLLLRLGYATSITMHAYQNPTGNHEVAYHLGVVDVERFKGEIASYLRSASKIAGCSDLSGHGTNNRTRGSWVDASFVREIVRTASGTLGTAVRMAGIPKGGLRQCTFAGHEMVAKLAAATGSPALQSLERSRWVRIRGIEADGFEDVFDISVEGISSFVAEGIVVHNCFQESLMRLGTVISGFDASQRSVLRKAVGKKDAKKMAEVGQMLAEGAEKEFFDEDGTMISPKFSAKTAAHMFELMKGSASYLFNASHSAAYAQLAFVTAYLKANWPVEYAAAILAIADKDDKRMNAFWSLKADGITVLAPDVNLSLARTAPVNGSVLMGLAEVKEVGVAGHYIVAERNANGPFKNLHDVLTRVTVPGKNGGEPTKLPVGAIQGLIEAGALDSFGPRLGQLMTLRAAHKTDLSPIDAEWSDVEESTRQRQRLGVSLGTHPLQSLKEEILEWEGPGGGKATPLHKIADENGEAVLTVGVISMWEEKGYSGGRRANFALESSKVTIQGVMWDRTLSNLRRRGAVPKVGDVVAVSGRVNVRTTSVGDDDSETQDTITTKELSIFEVWPIASATAPEINEPPAVIDFAAKYRELRAANPDKPKGPDGGQDDETPKAPAAEPETAVVAEVTDLDDHRKKSRSRLVVVATSALGRGLAGKILIGESDVVKPHLITSWPTKKIQPGSIYRVMCPGDVVVILLVKSPSLGHDQLLEISNGIAIDDPRWTKQEGPDALYTWYLLEQASEEADEAGENLAA